MSLLLNLVFFVVSCLALVFLGSIIVKSLSKLAIFFRMSEFILAFGLMTFATTLPEIFVAINAAIVDNSDLVLGTVIGANIATLGLVAGIAIILGRGIVTSSKVIRKDAYWMVLISILAVILMFLGKQLSRLDGVILIIVFLVYFTSVLKSKKKYKFFVKDHIKKISGLGYFLIFLVSVPLLFFVSSKIVFFAQELATGLMLPIMFIGLFFVALGTSLPELVFGIISVRTGHSDMAIGNLIGAVVVNSTLVLGIAAIISPITADFFLFITSSVFMILVCLTFAVFLETKGRLSWKEGIVLLMMYVLFLIVELNLKSYYLTGSFGA